MKNYIYGIFAAGMSITLASCANEGMFENAVAQGAIDCKNLDVDYVNSRKHTRANEDLLPDFNIRFLKKEGNEDIGKNYKYGQMPEIISLPVGTYYAKATYGKEEVAAWESPYYVGISEDITIEENKITQAPGTVMCKLQNIRVKVNTAGIKNFAEDDVVVTVRVGKAGVLAFDKVHEGQAGYFKYDEGSTTITALFSGTVNDATFTDIPLKLYTDAEPGLSYIINLTVDKPENNDNGGVSIGNGFTINTNVETKDENFNVDPDKPNEGATEDRENDRKGSTGENE